MHDTHLQLHKLPKLTPAELSRQKAERDAAQMLELQKARAKQEDLARARLVSICLDCATPGHYINMFHPRHPKPPRHS
jgi:hypothetical protein